MGAHEVSRAVPVSVAQALRCGGDGFHAAALGRAGPPLPTVGLDGPDGGSGPTEGPHAAEPQDAAAPVGTVAVEGAVLDLHAAPPLAGSHRRPLGQSSSSLQSFKLDFAIQWKLLHS